MLTYEDALCHKMLLEAGVRGELAPVIERLLAEEDPLSDVAADLAFAGNDANRQISALNKYLSNKDEADINMDAVHEKLIAYFRSIYEKRPEELAGLVNLMYDIGTNSEYAYENWHQLWECSDYYLLTLDGTISQAKFREYIEAFLYRGESISPWEPEPYPQKQDLRTKVKNASRRKGEKHNSA